MRRPPSGLAQALRPRSTTFPRRGEVPPAMRAGSQGAGGAWGRRAVSALAGLLFTAVFLFAPGNGAAQDSSPGFYSPSRNIRCGFPIPDEFICEIIESDWPMPARDDDCMLDEFRQLIMNPVGPPGLLADCRGDTWLDPGMAVLPYGEVWERDGVRCESARTGVTCRNLDDHGWHVRRARVDLF